MATPRISQPLVATVTCDDDVSASETAVPALPKGGGIGWSPLFSNMGIQALYTAVPLLGVSLLLAPFDGPNGMNLLGMSPPWDAYPGAGSALFPSAWWSAPAEVALGSGVALAELTRQGVFPPEAARAP